MECRRSTWLDTLSTRTASRATMEREYMVEGTNLFFLCWNDDMVDEYFIFLEKAKPVYVKKAKPVYAGEISLVLLSDRKSTLLFARVDFPYGKKCADG